jgi:hypothetical protein
MAPLAGLRDQVFRFSLAAAKKDWAVARSAAEPWLRARAAPCARTPTRCCRISDTVKHCGDEAAFAAILFDLFCGLLPNRNIFWVSSVLNAES